MDKWGILIFVLGLLAYFVTRFKYPIFVFISGVGAGIIIGAVWAYSIVMNAFP